MTIIVKGAANVAKINAAKVAAERGVHIKAFSSTMALAVGNANRAHMAVTDTLISATLELATLKVFKGAKPTDFDRDIRPVLKAALEPLQTVGAATKAAYVTGARNLFLAKANGIAPGTPQLSQAGWNSGIVSKLQAKGVMPAADASKPSKGRPKGTTAGKVNPGAGRTGTQQDNAASKGAASVLKILTPEVLQETLRLAGIGEHTEQLAHMILNEKPVLIKWLDSIAN